MGIFNRHILNAPEQLSEERNITDEINESTLEAITANIMIADANHKVIKATPATLEMLKSAEADIKTDLPDFSVEKVIGSHIDIFHKNPSHQKSMLDSLKATHITKIKLGIRTFELIANPIFNTSQVRLGTVVEWKDLTEAVRNEEIENIKKEEERKTAELNSSIKISLDSVTSNVMVANSENVITYANPAVIALLKNAEKDIQKELPNFQVSTMIGSNIDIFHKNPSHQRNILKSLTQTHRTIIKVGIRTFSLIATPIFSNEGKN